MRRLSVVVPKTEVQDRNRTAKTIIPPGKNVFAIHLRAAKAALSFFR